MPSPQTATRARVGAAVGVDAVAVVALLDARSDDAVAASRGLARVGAGVGVVVVLVIALFVRIEEAVAALAGTLNREVRAERNQSPEDRAVHVRAREADDLRIRRRDHARQGEVVANLDLVRKVRIVANLSRVGPAHEVHPHPVTETQLVLYVDVDRSVGDVEDHVHARRFDDEASRVVGSGAQRQRRTGEGVNVAVATRVQIPGLPAVHERVRAAGRHRLRRDRERGNGRVLRDRSSDGRLTLTRHESARRHVAVNARAIAQECAACRAHMAGHVTVGTELD